MVQFTTIDLIPVYWGTLVVPNTRIHRNIWEVFGKHIIHVGLYPDLICSRLVPDVMSRKITSPIDVVKLKGKNRSIYKSKSIL